MSEMDPTPEEKALQEHLLSVLFEDRMCPTPVHFAARAEIRILRAHLAERDTRIAELEAKLAKKGSTAGNKAGKADEVKS